jgi:hypothetical protein
MQFSIDLPDELGQELLQQADVQQHVGWVEERNPANQVTDWEYSFCHRRVTRGIYPMDLATNNPNVIEMALK